MIFSEGDKKSQTDARACAIAEPQRFAFDEANKYW